jgi:signal transduction histidine kinase/BarA-like signal transduction histidine kinase
MRKLFFVTVLLVCLLGSSLISTPAQAINREQEEIKVAVYNNSNYAYQDEHGVWRGMDIECMLSVAQRAGFKAVFIDSANDADFLGHLNTGAYDIVADVVKTPERARQYLFADTVQGTASSTLAVRAQDDRWEYGDLNQLSRMKIGTIASYFTNDMFRKWCQERGLSPTIVEYPNIETLTNALETGKIDGEIYTALFEKSSQKKFRAILHFLPREYYFVFRKDDTRLKNRFDSAMTQLLAEDPYYLSNLKKKYDEQFNYQTPLYTATEKQYLAGAPLIKVAVVADNAPYFVQKEQGVQRGIIPEYFKVLGEKTGLKFRFVTYATYEEALKAVRNSDVAVLSAFMGGLVNANEDNLVLTNTYINDGNVIITLAENNSTQPRSVGLWDFAVTPNARERGLELSKAEVKFYKNARTCLAALDDKQIEAAVFSLPVATWLLNQTSSSRYTVRPLPSLNTEISMALRPGDKNLFSILNKGIMVTNNYKSSIVAGSVQPENSWRVFMARLSPTALTVSIGILLALVAVLAWSLFMLNRRQQERAAVLATRAETEKQKIKVEAMQKTAEEHNRFFANISHDMRTPLNAILGFSDLAARETRPETVQDYIQKIHTSGKLLLDLVNDTLTMSRLTSNKLQVKLEPACFDEENFLKPVLTAVQSLAKEKGITFTIDSAGILMRNVLTDKLILQKIVLNLLTNAVKYTPRGGHVTARFRNEEAADGGIDSIIAVQDDGIGISPEFQKKIFEPFAQEKRAGYENQGTGLGLAIVKQMVDLLGGTITVASVPDKGSTFTVRLRMQETAATLAAPAGTAAAPLDLTVLAGHKLLLCEDNALNREIANALLKSKGLEVTNAENGRLGVDTFAASPEGTFSAILMDVRMPVLDGLAAAKEIRGLDRADSKTIPIIAMTADAFADDIQKCLDAGMNDHIAKPVEPAVLFATLAKYVK